jgi:hypothetical protein
MSFNVTPEDLILRLSKYELRECDVVLRQAQNEDEVGENFHAE